MKPGRLMFSTIFAVGILASGAVSAQDAAVHYEYAPVVDYEPIYVTERVPVEREVCWQERGYRRHGGSATGTIAGAIIGGVIGNQFGGGSGKKALTAAGAALGASIGHDATRRHRHGHPVSHERCEIRVDYESRSYTSGYLVRYEYEGRIYETQTAHPPGDRIRLEVAARPVD
ncbi:MAG: glycine zipper 2TM domain-containing protein [Wenzhouxiangellaceae bacterium]|nr:glycine zipper 2TM domain-containing protein [Wenzhouxiangellaceae bacterium]